MGTVLIGIDDTDNPSSIGTGQLARRLSSELELRGARALGVTRHQFLVDEAIPYTSHNSGACIGLAVDASIEMVRYAFDFVACNCADGSDPGVCIGFKEDVSEDIIEFAARAKTDILEMESAFDLVDQVSVKLRGLGGNCLGVIGALSSVGLRAQGNDGRFIDFSGLRQLPRRVQLSSFEEIGIIVEHKIDGREPFPGDIYDTQDWVRPRLVESKPLLIVEWSEDAWIPVDRKTQRHSGQHSQV